MSDRGRGYKCVSADPNWEERGGGKITRGAQKHYPLQPKEQIVQTMAEWLGLYWWSGAPRLDCKIDVESGCHLWCWATDSFLRDALWVMGQLGFRYIRQMVWVKLADNEYEGGRVIPMAIDALQIGLGQYLRGSHEVCLLGVRGTSMVPPPENRMPSVVFAERGRHSAKPDKAIKVIERVSPGPRLEMFARNPRPGWIVVGNEVDG